MRQRTAPRDDTPRAQTLALFAWQETLRHKFRRQHPIDRFILDFFCFQHNLAIEIGGHSHYEPDQREYDQARTERIGHYGIRVIRFTNRDVDTNIEGVLAEIARVCGVGDGFPPSSSPQRGED
jgi:very-short-patch-repair endonuclease